MKTKSRNQPIEKIRKRFDREWLLIEVTEIDECRSVPKRGRLLFHSPRRHEVYDVMMGRPEHLMITYSEDALPAGYAAAF